MSEENKCFKCTEIVDELHQGYCNNCVPLYVKNKVKAEKKAKIFNLEYIQEGLRRLADNAPNSFNTVEDKQKEIVQELF